MPVYHIRPNDLFFFRDARPMTAGVGSGGHGANWPMPSVFFDAIHAALYRAYPEKLDGEHIHAVRVGRENIYDRREKRFGSLQTAGPFPVAGGQWLFPAPADMVYRSLCGKEQLAMLTPCDPAKFNGASDNLPKPLRYSLFADGGPSKMSVPEWVTKETLEASLAAELPCELVGKKHGDIFDAEWYTGIGIDAETGTQDGERIYSAEYMRLKPGVVMGTVATMLMKDRDNAEGLEHLFKDGSIVIMGGQQRPCSVLVSGEGFDAVMPRKPELKGTRVKWVLLSPAIFPEIAEKPEKAIRRHSGGWLPNWVDPIDGRVLLTAGAGREKARRLKVAQGGGIGASLVAARVGKPAVFSGWTVHGEQTGAKGTLLAVPAGTVYYFEADSVEDARKLADSLHLRRRSSIFGEKGFGLGVCGVW